MSNDRLAEIVIGGWLAWCVLDVARCRFWPASIVADDASYIARMIRGEPNIGRYWIVLVFVSFVASAVHAFRW